jgi:hypothetical protein
MLNLFSCEFDENLNQETFLSAVLQFSKIPEHPFENNFTSFYFFFNRLFHNYSQYLSNFFLSNICSTYTNINRNQLNKFINKEYDRDVFISIYKYVIPQLYIRNNNYSSASVPENILNFFDNLSDEIIETYFYPILSLSVSKNFSHLPFSFLNFSVSLNSFTGKDIYSSLVDTEKYKKENLDLYPLAVREILLSGYYAIERPPFKLSVDFKPGNAYSSFPKMKKLDIWVPWTLTFINPNNVNVNNNLNHLIYIFVSDGSLDPSGERKYVPCPFPNSYNDGHICFSTSLENLSVEEQNSNSVLSIYRAIFNDYFAGGWNTDINNATLSRAGYIYGIYPNSSFFERDSYSFLTPSQKKSLYFNSLSSDSTKKQYINFFRYMAGLTLSETIDFYSSLTNNFGYSYKELIENTSYPFADNTVKLSFENKITSSSINNSTISQLKTSFNIFIILKNLHNQNYVDFNYVNSNSLTNKIISIVDVVESKVDLSNLYKVLLEYSKKVLYEYSYNQSHFLIYDFSNNEHEFISSDLNLSVYSFMFKHFENLNKKESLSNV